jgi:hypothetical protein
MPPRRRSSLEITPGQAQFVLNRLIKERRISEGDVTRVVAQMEAEIDELEQRLAALRATAGGRSGAASRSGGRPARSRKPVSPEVAASRRIQGEYMGLIRHLSATQRNRFKKVAQADGREAAIKQMRAALAK